MKIKSTPIKYKAFWHKNKQITPVGTIHFLSDDIKVHDKAWTFGWVSKDCTLLQWTGFFDHEDVEIYQDDIVDFIDENGVERAGIATYHQDRWFLKDGDYQVPLSEVSWYSTKVRVLGNVNQE